MKNLVKLFLISLILLSTGLLAKGPQPFEAKYEVTYGLISLGTGVMKLAKVDEFNYLLTFEAETDGVVSWLVENTLIEKSWLSINYDDRLVTDKYFFKLEGDHPQEHTVLFEYLTGTIRRLDGKESWEIDTDLATDRLAFAFAMGNDLLNGYPLRQPFIIAGYHHLWRVEFENKGVEKRSYAGAEYDTVHMHAKYKDEEIDIWLDENQEYRPVEISFDSGSGWSSRYVLSQ